MTSKKKLDLPEWNQRLHVASEELRLAVEELSALCSARGVDLDAKWCQQLILFVRSLTVMSVFSTLKLFFEAEGENQLGHEAGSEPPSALYVKSH